MVAALTDIHHTTCVHGNINRKIQFPSTLTAPAKHPQEVPICREDLDTVVVSVHNIHIPGSVAGDTTWINELTLATAFPPKAAGIGEVGVQNLNSVVLGICHIHLAIVGIECDIQGVKELLRSIPLGAHCSQEFACRREFLDPVIASVCHQNVPHVIQRYASRMAKLSLS